MFHNKQPKIFLLLEFFLPLLVIPFGIVAIFCYTSDAWAPLEFWHSAAMLIGVTVCLTEIILGFVSFILMFVNLFRQNKIPHATAENLILWFSSGIFLIGTLLLMLLVQSFTYAQSV